MDIEVEKSNAEGRKDCAVVFEGPVPTRRHSEGMSRGSWIQIVQTANTAELKIESRVFLAASFWQLQEFRIGTLIANVVFSDFIELVLRRLFRGEN